MNLASARIVCAIALLAVAAPTGALAQSRDSRDLGATVERLERQLQTLERTVYRGQQPPAGAVSSGAGAPPAALSDLQITTTSLEEQMRRLTGQVEQLQFQVRQLNDRMDRLVADVDFRLRELEGGAGNSRASRGGGAEVAPAAPQAPGSVTVQGAGAPRSLGTLTESQLRASGVQSAAPAQGTAVASVPAGQTVSLPDGSVQERYNYARQFLLRRDFANAETALAAFVDAHPEDPLAGNAQYWLGETFYVRGDYQTAAVSFAKGFQQYPDSGKAPDNLLKLGMSLGQLGQAEDACITLKKLRVEYPEAPTSIVQRADREIGRLQCR
ncbi:MAG: tol-pal system protein YbgF [Alphaproteobacteria bacterium]|nr:tol-pal system protein YbgF [Alphaproteobacteria bacterium]